MNSSDKPISELYSFDVNPVAYVRPVITEQGKNYGVYTADGTQLAIFSTQDAAYFAAKQHDLEPVLIH